jgi:hypothetical protein
MTDQMLPGDVVFTALADEFVAAMLAGDQGRAARALSRFNAETIKRTVESALQAARILAMDAAERALAPLDARVDALEKKVGDDRSG